MMDTRLKLEIAGGIVLLALLGLFAYEQYQKAVGNAVAQEVANRLKEAQKPLDAKIAELTKLDADRQKDYEQKTANLSKMTPQQIVVKLPQYVPLAPAPVHVFDATEPIVQSGTMIGNGQTIHAGDALVPQADVQPIAQKLLDGDKCSKDLAGCQQKTDAWQKKFGLKQNEAGEWEQAARGGSPFQKSLKCLAVRGGVGAGSGAIFATDKRAGAIGGLSIGAVSCFLFKP